MASRDEIFGCVDIEFGSAVEPRSGAVRAGLNEEYRPQWSRPRLRPPPRLPPIFGSILLGR